MRHAQHIAAPFQKKKLAVIISTLLACGVTNAFAVAPYTYTGAITEIIDTDDPGFIPMTNPGASCATYTNPCTLHVASGANITFIGSNFELTADASNGIPVVLGSGVALAPAAFLTIRGTPNSKARITGIDGNAVAISTAANGRLTLDNVVIAQTGTLGTAVLGSGATVNAPASVDIFNSDITYRAGLYGTKFISFTVKDSNITAMNGDGITLSEMSELNGTGLDIRSYGGYGIFGTAAGVGATSTFKYIRLTDSDILTTGSSASATSYSGIRMAVQTQPITQLIDRLYLDDVRITTTGENAAGLYAYFTKGTIENSYIKTAGTGAHGIWFTVNGGLQINKTKIETDGQSAHGAWAFLSLSSASGTIFGPIKLMFDKATISTVGQTAHAAYSYGSQNGYGNALIDFSNGSNLKTQGASAYLMYASAGGIVNAKDTTGTTSGSGAHAAVAAGYTAQGKSAVNLERANLSSSGDSASLLRVLSGGVLTGKDITGLTSGVNASALMLTGAGSATTLSPSANDYTNTATLENSILTSKLGKGIEVLGGASSIINLTDTHIYAGSTLNASNRQSFTVDAQDVYHSTSSAYLGSLIAKDVNLTATSSLLDGNVVLDRQSEVTLFDFDHSVLKGNISLRNNSQFNRINLKNQSHWQGSALVDATGSYIQNVAIDASSQWTLTGGNSVVGNVNNAGVIFFNAPAAGGNYQTLRIKGDYTGGGALWMNGLLRSNDADSKVDFLTIEGNVLGGATQVHFLSTDALGTATTGQGIKVIEALGNASAGDFVQANYVNAGAYRYSLVAGESNGAFDGSWYLTSEVTTNPPIPPTNPPPVTPPTPPTVKPPLKDEGTGGGDDGDKGTGQQDYGNTVMAAGVLPSLANYLSLTALGTYQDRMAGTDNRQNAKGAWARSYNGSSNVSISKGNFETQGASHDRDIVGLQVGQDLYRDDTDARSRRFGVYVGASHVKSQVDDDIRGGNAGKVSLDGYNLGVYWTHQTPEGWFVDINTMATAYRNAKIRMSDDGTTSRTQGWGATTSVEVGYKQAFGDGWFVEPQGQLIYQRVNLKDAYAGRNMRVSYSDSNTLTSRLGARVGKHMDKAENATLYTRMDILHTMGANSRTGYSNPNQINPTTTALSGDMGGSWLQVGAGLNGALTKKTSVFGSVDYQHRIDGSKGNGVVGLLGVKHVW